MKVVIVLLAVLVLFIFFLWLLDKKFHIGFIWRSALMCWGDQEPFPFEEIRKDPLPTAVCVDLGAFPKPLPDLSGIETIVIMEDRTPEFFLGYESYQPCRPVPLNRHGPLKNWQTQEDLAELVAQLHNQEKKVLIGFWGFWGDGLSQPSEWLLEHPELKPRKWGESDIGNPFAVLKKEGVGFTQYIAGQYRKLHDDFDFDGLFLGDGLCGFRSFIHPERYSDKSGEKREWAEFYWKVAQAVHIRGGTLWAYDCMGFDYLESRRHGADYKLLAQVGLDVLVFQSYPTAWVKYFKLSGKKGLSQDIENFLSIKENVSGEPTKLYYSLEMGDSREGWYPKHKTTKTQMIAFQKHADGKFLVWGNETLSNMGDRE